MCKMHMRGGKTMSEGKFAMSLNYIDFQKEKHPACEKDGKRSAVVFGSDKKSNIGSAIAKKLRSDNFYVVEHNRDSCDLSKDNIKFKGNEDSLILSNGHMHLDWIEDFPEEEVFKIINDTLISSIRATNQFVRQTLEMPHKKYIIFIGSMAYKSVLNGSSVYCASKAGISQFARCIAWELAPKGYNVISINPSNTENTPMTEKTIRGIMRYRSLNRQSAEGYWGSILPKKEWLQSDEIAEVASFFLSGKADYMSGSQVDLAGGQR